MSIVSRETGLRSMARSARQLPPLTRSSAEQAVRVTIRDSREFVIRRTGEKYNLRESTIRDHVFARRVSFTANKASGSLELQIKAIPLSEFGARVEPVRKRLRSAFGRPTRSYTRTFFRVRVSLYKNRRARVLPGAFPIGQRRAGALQPGARVRKRVGSGRGVRRDGSLGNKLTGFRYYTFPRRLTRQVLRETQRRAGDQLRVSFRVAFRNGFSELRQNTSRA